MATDVRKKLTATMKIAGKEFILTELSDEGQSNLDNYCKRKVYEAVAVGIDGLPEGLQDKIIAQATKEAAITTFMSPTGVKHIATVEGLVEVLYQLLLPNQPDLTRMELAQLVTEQVRNDKDTSVIIRKITKHFAQLNLDPISKKGKGDQANGKKSQRKKNKKKLKQLRLQNGKHQEKTINHAKFNIQST